MFLGVNVQTHFFAPTFVAFAPMVVTFASTFVAFAPMILLSYSSFECLSHTPYLEGAEALSPGRALKKSPFLRTKTEKCYDL